MPNRLTITTEGNVILNGQKILKCSRVDIKNINPFTECTEIVLHIDVDELDIQYPSKQTE